jgi:hypothetical protein
MVLQLALIANDDCAVIKAVLFAMALVVEV